jgi:hypothetical protein
VRLASAPGEHIIVHLNGYATLDVQLILIFRNLHWKLSSMKPKLLFPRKPSSVSGTMEFDVFPVPAHVLRITSTRIMKSVV